MSQIRNSDVIFGALAIICEDQFFSQNNQDYNMRAQYLLANFIIRYAPLDTLYREANGIPPTTENTDIVVIDPEDDFPLCNIFAPVAMEYLASALVIDENEEISDRLFDRYINGILSIRQTLPAKQQAIIDRYGFD